VQPAACPAEHAEVAGHAVGLGRRGLPGQAEGAGHRPRAHHPAGALRVVLRVDQHAQAERVTPGQRLGEHRGLGRAAPVVRQGAGARRAERLEIARLPPLEPPGERRGHHDPHPRTAGDDPDQAPHHLGSVERWPGVGHAHDGGVAAGGRGGRARGHALRAGLARLAEVHVQVDQAGHHPQPVRPQHPIAGPRPAAGIPGPQEGAHPPARELELPPGVEGLGGVDHPPAEHQGPLHPAWPSLTRCR